MPYYPSRSNQQPSGPPPKKRKLFSVVILSVSILLLVYGAVRLIGYGADWLSSRRTTQEIRKTAEETDSPVETVSPTRAAAALSSPAPVPSGPPEAEENTAGLSDKLPPIEYSNGFEVNPRIQKLRKKYEYIIGWITMDDLDEPVAMKDNTFFLNHDAAGNRNGNGAIFMDEDTGLLTRPYTILLYGHNMKTGSMFGNLKKYEDSAYCSRHRVFRFDTLYEEGQYAIFAVATIHLTPGLGRYVSLTDIRSTDRVLRKEALQALANLSPQGKLLDVNEEDQLLLLVTCTGDDDERLVVASRRLRENEQPDSLTWNSHGTFSLPYRPFSKSVPCNIV